MAGRREKLRHVGIIPEYRGFTPDGLASGDAIDMTVDELEVLRLCDLEGLNQEAVAQQMGIARATVAAICSRSRIARWQTRWSMDGRSSSRAAISRTPPSPRRRPHGQQRRSTP